MQNIRSRPTRCVTPSRRTVQLVGRTPPSARVTPHDSLVALPAPAQIRPEVSEIGIWVRSVNFANGCRSFPCVACRLRENWVRFVNSLRTRSPPSAQPDPHPPWPAGADRNRLRMSFDFYVETPYSRKCEIRVGRKLERDQPRETRHLV